MQVVSSDKTAEEPDWENNRKGGLTPVPDKASMGPRAHFYFGTHLLLNPGVGKHSFDDKGG